MDVDVYGARHATRSVVRGLGRTHDRAVGPVAPVPRLGERVGAEGRELLRREQFFHRRRDGVVAVEEVEVVDDLTAFVTEVTLVLEASRTSHERENLAFSPP
jgi:hypothetical protein